MYLIFKTLKVASRGPLQEAVHVIGGPLIRYEDLHNKVTVVVEYKGRDWHRYETRYKIQKVLGSPFWCVRGPHLGIIASLGSIKIVYTYHKLISFPNPGSSTAKNNH